MKKIIVTLGCLSFLGCAPNKTQIQDVIKKNPKIVFDVIEENPEEFIEVVNKAAQEAQKKRYEKQIADMKKEQEEELKNPKKPELSKDKRLMGSDSGNLVVVEYADFECPACGMAYEPLKEFKEKHKGQIQFYYKNMPLSFHPMAQPAALYFEAVRKQGNDKALKFYNYVFSHQREIKEKDFFKKAVKAAGANLSKVEKDRKSEAVEKAIKADMAEFEKFGFTGTPVVLINGVSLHGAQRLEELERVAELTLKK